MSSITVSILPRRAGQREGDLRRQQVRLLDDRQLDAQLARLVGDDRLEPVAHHLPEVIATVRVSTRVSAARGRPRRRVGGARARAPRRLAADRPGASRSPSSSQCEISIVAVALSCASWCSTAPRGLPDRRARVGVGEQRLVVVAQDHVRADQRLELALEVPRLAQASAARRRRRCRPAGASPARRPSLSSPARTSRPRSSDRASTAA